MDGSDEFEPTTEDAHIRSPGVRERRFSFSRVLRKTIQRRSRTSAYALIGAEYIQSWPLSGMSLRYLLYGIRILLGLALAVAGFVEGDSVTIVAWLVVAVSGAISFWNDSGRCLAV